MNLADYQELTGQQVPSAREAAVEAGLDRAQTLLEDLVGFPLDPDVASENEYQEAGKVAGSTVWLSCDYLDNAVLQPADAVVGAYRLFDFDPRDPYLATDPMTAVHAVKLVVGNVTVYTFDPRHISLRRKGRANWGKYLDLRHEWTVWLQQWDPTNCTCGRHQRRLAVDADWVGAGDGGAPKDLQFVLAEMGAYYADPKRNVRSESRGTRSFTLATVVAPQDEPANAAIIRRYAGPNGRIGVQGHVA